ncbi:GNAT family N-acetyltransferase [Streptomyces mirabilis]|uniref:GNAT family N-acetyltransferase n=1 Tax=Streptomyces mirabilis TaxID=68239 RepID=UPI00225A948A|nr:GNAT family N-acetyltransferase [Streptomyces mirabilis]MCX4617874.1 hypothetical protein [Streptomyces mirabilis]
MGYHAQSLIDHQQRRYEKLYIAVIGDEVVGVVEGMFADMEAFGSGELPPPRARIVNLLDSSHHRRTGIGSTLVQRFVIDAQAAQPGAAPRASRGRRAHGLLHSLRHAPDRPPRPHWRPLETIRTALT